MEIENPTDYMRHVDYCTTSVAFKILFHYHCDRQICVSSNTNWGDFQVLNELREEMNDHASNFNFEQVHPNIYIHRGFKL